MHLSQIKSQINRFQRDEDGAPTMEFIILFPLFFLLTVWVIEMGLVTLRWASFERSVDLALRELKVGGLKTEIDEAQDGDVNSSQAHDLIKAAVCDTIFFFPDCTAEIVVEMDALASTEPIPASNKLCVDKSEDIDVETTILTGTKGAENVDEIVYIRACIIGKTIFVPDSFLALPITRVAGGGYQLSSNSAYINEPL